MKLLRQILKPDQVTVIGQSQQHFQGAQQLPHITGPGITGQGGDSVRCQSDAPRITPQFAPEIEDKTINVCALPQRQDAQAEFLNAIQQIFAECPCRDPLFQILMGGTDKREIDRIADAAAERRDRLFLQHPQ